MGVGAALRPGQPDEAVLYAGAGIVAESDPELEHTETGTKLGSFGRALGVDTRGRRYPLGSATNALTRQNTTAEYNDGTRSLAWRARSVVV